jgi:hypothetical protein
MAAWNEAQRLTLIAANLRPSSRFAGFGGRVAAGDRRTVVYGSRTATFGATGI